MAAWLVAFLLPAVYFLLLVLEDLLHLGWGDKPGSTARVTGMLLYIIPLIGVTLCCCLALLSPLRLGWKLGWVALSLIGMAVQFVVLFLSLGIFYMERHGLEGVF